MDITYNARFMEIRCQVGGMIHSMHFYMFNQPSLSLADSESDNDHD